jgi:type IV secretory pathway TraG/TraD family ATPase VirD4
MLYLHDHTKDKAKFQQVLNIMDEAGRTALPEMHDYCSTGVGRGLIFWMAFQSPAQVRSVYGHANADTIWDNMDTQIYYRPPNHKTAKELRDFLGDVSGFAHSTTSREGHEASESQVEQPVPLLSAQDIRKMGNDEVLIFHSNLTPIRTKRMDFRRFPELVERMRIPAPPLRALPPLPEQSIIRFGQGTGESHAEFVNPDEFV